MIGLSFLLRLLMIGFYAVVFLAIVFVAVFLVTWAIRLFAEGMGITLGDHAAWLRSKMPKIKFPRRKRLKK
jgi:hypothetical protein